MTTVRRHSHHSSRKRPALITFGVVLFGLLAVFAVLWGIGALRSPDLETTMVTDHVTDPPTREAGIAPEAIYDRYDDCIVNAAAICTT